jgi:hypothetical protein
LELGLSCDSCRIEEPPPKEARDIDDINKHHNGRTRWRQLNTLIHSFDRLPFIIAIKTDCTYLQLILETCAESYVIALGPYPARQRFL